MARNKLTDLSLHLFALIERLNDDDLTPEVIEAEVKKAKAICSASTQIINIQKLTLQAVKMVSDGLIMSGEVPEEIGLKRLNHLND
jgi:hypothetical protein